MIENQKPSHQNGQLYLLQDKERFCEFYIDILRNRLLADILKVKVFQGGREQFYGICGCGLF